MHIGLGHIGVYRLQYEIIRIGYFWNNITREIYNYAKQWVIFTTPNSNKLIKPTNKQILSYYPMERVEMDLIKLSKIHFENNTDYNYILCFVAHFRKYAKIYFTKTKEAEEILEHFKDYLSKVGKPSILQPDNGGKFCAKIIKNFLKNEGIISINSSSHRP